MRWYDSGIPVSRHLIHRYLIQALLLIRTIFPVLLLLFEQTTWATTSLPIVNKSTSFTLQKKTDHSGFRTYGNPSHKTSLSPVTGLPVMEDGQTALPSNAFNFHGSWNASVDRRTGTPSFSMAVAGMLFDHGQSKRDLVLSWAGSPSPGGPDTFGVGSQWKWNLGTEHISTTEVAGHMTTDIHLGDGHGLTMISDRDAAGRTIWHPYRHKLHDVFITGQPGNWTVAISTGVRVHVSHGYEDWEESHDGKKVWFYYDHENSNDSTRHLVYICSHPLDSTQVRSHRNECRSQGIWLTYDKQSVTIHGQQKIQIFLTKNSGIFHPVRISMPSLSTRKSRPDNIEITYDESGNRPWLMHSVHYPTGITSTFLYNEESTVRQARTPGLSTGIHGTHLPVVTELVTHSENPAIPDRHVWYHYGSHHTDEHNYTGFKGNNSVIPGRDNLFDRSDDYTYEVTEDNGNTRLITTYNKYHLPVHTLQKDNRSGAIILQSTEQYLPWRHTVFTQLAPNYSLPIHSQQLFYGIKGKGQTMVHPKQIEQAWRYNDEGQVIWHRDTYGRETFTQYCPSKGDRHCPPMDSTWPQITVPEKILVLPAPYSLHKTLSSGMTENHDGKAIEYLFDYSRTPVHSGKGEHLHIWQVKNKTVITLAAENLAHLIPGAILPETDAGTLSTKTSYFYTDHDHDANYGQPEKIIIREYRDTKNFLHNPRKAIFESRSSNVPEEDSITIHIIRSVNESSKQRTIAISFSDNDRENSASSQSSAFQGRVLPDTTRYSLLTGSKMETIDAMGEMKFKWKYDSWNRPSSMTVTPKEGGQPQTTTWQYTFRHGESSIVTTYPDGNQKKSIFGPGDKPVSTWHRFRKHGSTTVQDRVDWIPDRAFTYTSAGKIKTMTTWHAADPENNGLGKPVSLTTVYGYDHLNRLQWKKYPEGQVDYIIHDDAHMRIIQYRMAPDRTDSSGVYRLGSMFSVIQSNVLAQPVASYIFPTDPESLRNGHPVYTGKLQSVLKSLSRDYGSDRVDDPPMLPLSEKNGLPDFIDHAITSGSWLTHTNMEYDGMGRRTAEIDGNGAEKHWIWKNGNLVATITPDGRLIHDSFNIRGQKTARCILIPGSNSCHVLGTRHFDANGYLEWQKDQVGNMIRYTHDADGRLLSMKVPGTSRNPEGHTFTYHYNSLGLLSAEMDGKPYVQYRYDPVTWRMTDKDDNVVHLHYTYDPDTELATRIDRTRPRTIEALSGIDYPQGSSSVAYDRYYHPVLHVDFAGNRYHDTHDIFGRITSTRVRMAGSGKAVVLTRIRYDAFNRPVRMSNGIGIKRVLLWNRLGQLASISDTRNRRLIQRFEYDYDPDTNNITRLVREEPDTKAEQTYQYDLQNNLVHMRCKSTGESIHGSLCPRETVLQGSGLNTPPIITGQDYTFDPWNNIKTVKESLVNDTGQVITKTTVYHYAGERQNIHENSKSHDPHQMTAISEEWSTQSYSTRPHSIEYDTLGRVVRDADGNRLTYNAFGQQDRFINVHTGEMTRYIYDSQGHQVAEQPFNSMGAPIQPPLYMIYNGNRIFARIQNDKHGRQHTAMELPGAHSEDGVITRWYLHDYKSDVVTTLDKEGKVASSNVYSPYGMTFDRFDRNDQSYPSLLSIAGKPLWWQGRYPEFNGEMNDPATGYQFPGGGYRAYNPVYRHFMVRDSYSPFIEINGYGFVHNNPVMNTDPTGHSHETAVYAIGIFSILLAAAMTTLLPASMFGALTSPLATESIACVATGTNTATVIAAINGVIFGSAGVISGSLQIANAAHPKNRSLAIANDIVGIINGVALAGFDLFSFGTYAVSRLLNANQYIFFGVLLSAISSTVTTGSTIGYNSLALRYHQQHKNLTHQGFSAGIKTLQYVSLAGMVITSIISGITLTAISKTIFASAGRRYSQFSTPSRSSALTQESFLSTGTDGGVDPFNLNSAFHYSDESEVVSYRKSFYRAAEKEYGKSDNGAGGKGESVQTPAEASDSYSSPVEDVENGSYVSISPEGETTGEEDLEVPGNSPPHPASPDTGQVFMGSSQGEVQEPRRTVPQDALPLILLLDPQI